MVRWLTFLLLLVVIASGVYNESPGIEQRLHGKVVWALADEDLSEVRVEMDGRDVLLTGPEELITQATARVKQISGVRQIETRIKTITRLDLLPTQNRRESVVLVKHPDELYWPIKKPDPVDAESELLVTKIQQSVEVNGAVPNYKIKREILAKIEQFIEIPEHLFDVSVNKVKVTPDWYLQDLPLIIPFVQWVEEGQLQYHGNTILVDGIVLNKKARKAIETAIANIPSQFQIENRLKIGKE